MSRIVFISPYADFTQLAKSVAQELNIQVEFYSVWLEDSLRLVKTLGEPPVDVLISRGGTAEYLAQNLDIPVIRANMSSYDLIECIHEAKKYSHDIVITLYQNQLVGKLMLEEILSVSITEIMFDDNLDELEHKISRLAIRGGYCIIGGGVTVSYAHKYGLPYVAVKTGRATIHEALLHAVQIAALHHEETRHAQRLKTILEASHEGIIAIDEHGTVEIYNKVAEKIFGIPTQELLGSSLVDRVRNIGLHTVLSTGKPKLGELCQIGNTQILMNKVPVLKDSRILGAVATFEEVSKVVQTEQRLRKEFSGKNKFIANFCFQDILGESKIMVQCKRLAVELARSELTVLIYGPSGTGKELFAQSIHNASSRAHQPFVAVNCGALPPSLLESELFGYEEGAFTGAKRQGKYGLFELAHKGTIFLDEIDSLPLEVQGRLLRVIQEKEVLRIGGESNISIDVRIIAATNTAPQVLLTTGKIREDLFYRLNVLYLELPSLSGRKEDIPLLCAKFSERFSSQSRQAVKMLIPYFLKYNWPGNIRELYNVIQRVSFYSEIFFEPNKPDKFLELVIPNAVFSSATAQTLESKLGSKLQSTESQAIVSALEQCGTIDKAAKQLGISRSTLLRKLKKIRAPFSS